MNGNVKEISRKKKMWNEWVLNVKSQPATLMKGEDVLWGYTSLKREGENKKSQVKTGKCDTFQVLSEDAGIFLFGTWWTELMCRDGPFSDVREQNELWGFPLM